MTVKDNEKDIMQLRDIVKTLSKILIGNGDGIGMDELVRGMQRDIAVINKRQEEIDNRQARMESDIKETKRMVQDIVGYAGVKYDKHSHPSRRAGDEPQKKDMAWLEKAWVEKIRPALVEKLIMAVFVILLWNLKDLIDLIAKSLGG